MKFCIVSSPAHPHLTAFLVQAALGSRRWDHLYQPKYGSVPDFMRTHPEAFYQTPNGAFYRPDAPARMPVVQASSSQHMGAPTASAAGGPSTALIILPGASSYKTPAALHDQLISPVGFLHIKQ